MYEDSPLSGLQAATATDRPLEAIEEAERKQILIEIARDIRAKLGQFDRLAGDAREQLRSRVEQRFLNRIEIGEELGSGDMSIVFRARQGLRELSVKALVSSVDSTRDREALRDLLQRTTVLRDPAFIPIYEASLDQEPICIVREYVAGDTLAHVLHGRALPAQAVVSYVRQLARALGEAHQHDMRHGRLTPSNIFIQGSRVRLSPVDLSIQLARSSRERGSYFSTSEALNYVIPEYYYGRCIGSAADQYALGLIALEMLQGRPPVRIRCLADLARLPAFYDNPRAFFKGTWQQEAPGLDRIIAKMLAADPRDRWGSMAEVVEAVGALIGRRQSFEVHVAEAKESYCRHCRNNPAFYAAFYADLCKRSDRARKLFGPVAMDRQYRMLDEAIEKLLNFREGPEPTTLQRVAEGHARFGLAAADFDLFEAAFMATLKAAGEEDPEALAAWYAALRPGMDYLKRTATVNAARPARKPAKRPGLSSARAATAEPASATPMAAS